MKIIEKVLLEDAEYEAFSKECKKLSRSRRAQVSQLIKDFLKDKVFQPTDI